MRYFPHFVVLLLFSPFPVCVYILKFFFHFIDRYIEEEDLLRFMIKEEVDLVFPLIEGWENGQIDKKALTNWVVRSLFYPFFVNAFSYFSFINMYDCICLN